MGSICPSKIKPHEVIVSIPREKLDDLLGIVNDMLGKNVVAIRAVRQLAGKSNHFASLVYVWRPFLSDLREALQEAENPQSPGHAPNGCIWVRQMEPALLWFRAFLHGKRAPFGLHTG